MTPGIVYDPGLGELLGRAARAYRRRDDDVFRRLMEEATDMAPQRIDLWLNRANHRIVTGDPAAALNILTELSRTVPNDVDTLFTLAHWQHFAEDAELAEATRRRLGTLRQSKAEDLARMWRTIGEWLARRISGTLPAVPRGAGVGIVVLGYALDADGGMRRELVDRLHKALEAVDAYPGSIIVPTGGVPQSGRVEAAEMRRWLVDMGVEAKRIMEEGYARDVAENLVYARQILDMAGVDHAVVVTSADSVRRAGAGMETLGWVRGSGWRVSAVAAAGKSFDEFRDDGRDRLKLYRDILRVYGMPTLCTFPGLVEL